MFVLIIAFNVISVAISATVKYTGNDRLIHHVSLLSQISVTKASNPLRRGERLSVILKVDVYYYTSRSYIFNLFLIKGGETEIN